MCGCTQRKRTQKGTPMSNYDADLKEIKEIRDEIMKDVNYWANEINKICNPYIRKNGFNPYIRENGLIPDEIKYSNEYIHVKTQHDVAFEKLQRFNKSLTNQQKYELNQMI